MTPSVFSRVHRTPYTGAATQLDQGKERFALRGFTPVSKGQAGETQVSRGASGYSMGGWGDGGKQEHLPILRLLCLI